jgi:hypothetical protein
LDASLTESDIPFIWFDADDMKESPSGEVQVHIHQVNGLGVHEGIDAQV